MGNDVHKQHRQRVRDKILNYGFDLFADHELLEFILFYAFRQGDTNVLAHRLLNHFGTFDKLIEATPYELMTVEGVGAQTALLLSTYLQVIKRYHLAQLSEKQVFSSTELLKEYFCSLCMGNKIEYTYALYLNKAYTFLKLDKLSEGTIDKAPVYPERILAAALTYGAYYVVFAHNHVSGFVNPSPEDIVTASAVAAALHSGRVCLLDAIIVDHSHAFSFAENRLIDSGRVIDPYAPPDKLSDPDF